MRETRGERTRRAWNEVARDGAHAQWCQRLLFDTMVLAPAMCPRHKVRRWRIDDGGMAVWGRAENMLKERS